MLKRLPRQNQLLAFLTLGICVFSIANAITGSWLNEWGSGDEYWHHRWSKRLFEEGITTRDPDITNFGSTTPVTALNVMFPRLLTVTGLPVNKYYEFYVRLPMVLWLTLLYISTFLFTRRYFGMRSAAAATLLVALDVNLVGHASLVAVDVPFACVSLWAMWGLLHYFRAPSIRSATIVGVGLAVAFAVKYSAALLCIFAAGIYLWTVVKCHRERTLNWRIVLHPAIVAIVAIFLVNMAYLFQGIGTPLKEFGFKSGFFSSVAVLVPDLPSPFAKAFLSGLDMMITRERVWPWNVVVLGKHFPNGVWYYMPVVGLVKTPLALVVVLILGFVALFRIFVSHQSQTDAVLDAPERSAVLHTVGCLAVFAVYFVFIFRVQVGLRFALMCIPYIAILAAVGLSKVASPRALAYLMVAASLLTVLERAPYFRNPLAFTNSIIWPKETAFRWITDSNIDWFQNYRRNQRWMNRQLPQAALNPLHLLPHTNVFSVNRIAGIWNNFAQHQWVRDNLDPVSHIGFTYVVFDVGMGEFKAFLRDERTVLHHDSMKHACVKTIKIDDSDYNRILSLKMPKADSAICIRFPNETYLRLQYERAGDVGIVSSNGDCQRTGVNQGEVVWYRFLPGTYKLCLNGDTIKMTAIDDAGLVHYFARAER